MQITLTIDDRELTVDADFCPAERGARDSYGVQLEPDHDATWEINSVTEEPFGHPINAGDISTADIIAAINDHFAEQAYEDRR